MAKINNQTVPPSLTSSYDAILDTTTAGSVAKVKASVRGNPVPPEIALKTQIVQSASNWLCDRWLDHPDPASRSSFYNERAVEIRNGTFNPTYWHEAMQLEDVAEYAVPTVTGFKGTVNPLYADADHQPSTCTYKAISATYATPSVPGTAEHPAPGWKGATIDKMWRDLWHVQRRVTFGLPITMSKTDTRPVVVVVYIAITATATHRGNKNWYAVAIDKTFQQPSGNAVLKDGAITHWNRRRGYNFAVPAENMAGWFNIVHREFIEDARYKAQKLPATNITKLQLRIATAPSLGFYGSRNDDVLVWHEEIVKVYQAK